MSFDRSRASAACLQVLLDSNLGVIAGIQGVDVKLVEFPETKVAVAEHRGPPALEYQTSRRLIEWRIQNRLPPEAHATFGVHYTNPDWVAAEEHKVDFCVSYEDSVVPNPQNIIKKVIPANLCATARHHGSRVKNLAALYLYKQWFPNSGRVIGDFPVFFHYVNVGPNVSGEEMITDVYLPVAR